MQRESVVIIGAGVGGLGSALALARGGHPVTLLERDPLPNRADAEEAFLGERKGAPQVHQTHAFLARLNLIMRERFPDVLEALLARGATRLPTTSNLGEPQPGDEDLEVIVTRRTTLDWVLRQAVLAEPGVTVRPATPVASLRATTAPGQAPTVDGVVLEDGTEVGGDIVVAAAGRRDPVPRWLAELAAAPAEEIHESGLMYLTRWYRLPEGFDLDKLDPKLGGDLGFVKYLGVPGDGGTLSITLAIRPDDSALRRTLSEDDAFEQACRRLPGPDQFFQFDLAPLGGVRPMGGLLNRRRRFLDETGAPLVLGFHAVGDSHTTTNPLYGRGCTLAMVGAVALADAAAAHPGDHQARARAYEAYCAAQVEPWYEQSVLMDRAGADPVGRSAGALGEGNPLGTILVAAATDPVLGRGFARLWNLVATPDELAAEPAYAARVAQVLAEPEKYPLPEQIGPTREELLAALAAA